LFLSPSTRLINAERKAIVQADHSRQERLRPHPEDRFAAAQIAVDLQTVIARLRSEPQAGERGHRQETLYRHGGYTIALFAFDRFTGLSEHKANGIVNMHVLRGCMKITAAGQVHELRAGQMLILEPRMEHAVAAEEEGEMLVTVHLVATDEGETPPAE
jgi:quercetin dioxygenase-like cupin family protein